MKVVKRNSILLEKIQKYCVDNDLEVMLLGAEFNPAITGFYQQFNKSFVTYDTELVLKILMDGGIETYEEALEYFDFNILGSYIGEGTPAFSIDLSNVDS